VVSDRAGELLESGKNCVRADCQELSGKSHAVQLGAFDSLARTRLTAQPDAAQPRSDAAVPRGLSYVVLAHQAV